MAQSILEVRLALIAHGFTPIPIAGKAPPFEKWQKVGTVSRAMLEAWDRNWPRASNTGLLTRVTPTIDIDILNEAAAVAAEALVRERFEERGYVLVRIGRPPKRAIPFRTLDPFPKLTTNFEVAPGTDAEKIEFLCDGQQFVAHGIHPDTRKPYSWFGGDPTTIGHDDLPDISADEARQLQTDITALLVRDFGYVAASARPPRQGNGAAAGAPEDWKILIDRIRSGQDLHASIRDLAAKMIRSGMQGGAAVNLLRGVMESADHSVARDKRWQARYDDIARSRGRSILRRPNSSRPPRLPPLHALELRHRLRRLRLRPDPDRVDRRRRHHRRRHQLLGRRQQPALGRQQARRSRTRSKYSGNGYCSTTIFLCSPCSALSPPTCCPAMRFGSD